MRQVKDLWRLRVGAADEQRRNPWSGLSGFYTYTDNYAGPARSRP